MLLHSYFSIMDEVRLHAPPDGKPYEIRSAFCYCSPFSILKLQQKNILEHTILYVHYVDLLIRSLTQLDFLFYDFSVIYYDFSKLL